MSRSKINLFPKHHILGMLGLANMKQHHMNQYEQPQFSWKIPGRDINQGSGYSLPNTQQWDTSCLGGDVVPRKCHWTQTLAWQRPWLSDGLPLLEAIPEEKLPHSLHLLEGSALLPAWTPVPQRLWTVGVSGTAEKSPAQGFLNIPASSEKEP